MNHLNTRPLGATRRYCRKCDGRVMERIDNGRALNVTTYLLFSVLTCGVGLLFPFLFLRPRYSLYCRRCDNIQEDR